MHRLHSHLVVLLALLLLGAPVMFAQQIPDDAYTQMCQQKGMDVRWSCSSGTPTDVPPAARASFLQGCIRRGDQVTNSCLTAWTSDNAVVFPHFLVLGLLYAPPGNASSASAGTTTQTGTIIGASKNFGTSDTVSVKVTPGFFGNGITVGGSVQSSSSTGHSEQATITTAMTNTETIRGAVNPGDRDSVNFHDQDEFLLWVNPQVSIKEGPTKGVYTNTVGTAAGESLNLVWVTAGELRSRNIRPELLADQHPCPGGQCTLLTGLHVLTEADMDAILSQDRLVNASPNQLLDPKHFRLIASAPITEGAATHTLTLSNTDQSVITDTQTEGNVDTITAGVNISTPFAKASVDFTHGWNWSTTTTQGTTTSTSTMSTVTLASTTPDCCGNPQNLGQSCFVSIYQDLTYHSFAFVPESSCRQFSQSPVAGTVTAFAAHIVSAKIQPAAALTALAMEGNVSERGLPVDHVMVTIFSRNNLIFKTFTDTNGKFAISSLPIGALTVSIRNKTFAVVVKKGKTAVVDAKF